MPTGRSDGEKRNINPMGSKGGKERTDGKQDTLEADRHDGNQTGQQISGCQGHSKRSQAWVRGASDSGIYKSGKEQRRKVHPSSELQLQSPCQAQREQTATKKRYKSVHGKWVGKRRRPLRSSRSRNKVLPLETADLEWIKAPHEESKHITEKKRNFQLVRS